MFVWEKSVPCRRKGIANAQNWEHVSIMSGSKRKPTVDVSRVSKEEQSRVDCAGPCLILTNSEKGNDLQV